MSEAAMIKMDKHTSEMVAEGQAAFGRIKKQESWQDWLRIGRAIDAGRTAMMSYLRINQPAGRVWSENWGGWLKETGFDALDKGTRSRLQNCVDELPAVEEWRQSIGLTKALTLTHPDTVWKKFQAARKPKIEAEKGEKQKAKDNLTMAVERLEEVSDKLETEPQFMLDLSDVESAAQTFLDYHGDELAKKFADMVSFLLLEKVAPDIARRVADVPLLSKQDAFRIECAGIDAHADGRRMDSNPYDVGTDSYEAWRRGWNEADEGARVEEATKVIKKRGRPAKAKPVTGVELARLGRRSRRV